MQRLPLAILQMIADYRSVAVPAADSLLPLRGGLRIRKIDLASIAEIADTTD